MIGVTILGSIMDFFQSIDVFTLLNILSDEADDAWTAKYCLATAVRFGSVLPPCKLFAVLGHWQVLISKVFE